MMTISELNKPSREILDDFTMDYTLAGAMDFYLTLGANPGGFASHVIWGDYQGAMVRAHAFFREPHQAYGGMTYAHVFFHYIRETLPSEVLGIDNFNEWTRTGGLSGPENMDTFIMLKMKEFHCFSKSWELITDHHTLTGRGD